LNELTECKDAEDKEAEKKKVGEIFEKKGIGKPRGTFEEKQKQYFEMIKSGKIKNHCVDATAIFFPSGEFRYPQSSAIKVDCSPPSPMMLFTTLLLSAFAAGYHLPEPPNCSEEELMNGYNYTLRGGWMDLSMYTTWPRDLNHHQDPINFGRHLHGKTSGQCLRKWITLLYQHPASFLQPVPPCQEIDPFERDQCDQCSFVLPRL
jgi:hypothetical protein